MVRIIRTLRNWNKRNGFKTATFAKEVEGQMTNNENFPDPAIPMPDMGKQATDLFEAYANRKNGAKAKSDYQTQLANTNEMLNKQADYVQSASKNNPTIIASSGFSPSTTSAGKKPVPGMPRIPTVKNEDGNLILSIDRIKYADTYFWMVFIGEAFPITISKNQMEVTGGSSSFIMIPAGTTRECIRGLVPGTKVIVQVLAQNSAGKSDFTSPITTFAVQG